MFNKDEGKIECAVGNQGDKAEIVLILFLRRDSRYLFVSGSWYGRIQTTRLNVFFLLPFSSQDIPGYKKLA